jgi:hypothetical protein
MCTGISPSGLGMLQKLSFTKEEPLEITMIT